MAVSAGRPTLSALCSYRATQNLACRQPRPVNRQESDPDKSVRFRLTESRLIERAGKHGRGKLIREVQVSGRSCLSRAWGTLPFSCPFGAARPGKGWHKDQLTVRA